MRTTWAGALVGLLLAVGAGCAEDKDERPIANADNDRPAETTEPTRPADDDTTVPVDDGEVTPPPTKTVAETEVEQVPLRVEIKSLKRIGERLELTFEITNQAEAATDTRDMVYWPGRKLGAGDVRSVRMVSQDNVEGFYPLVDDTGNCLCSSDLAITELHPGESIPLFATYAGVPPSITSVDVYVPGFPPSPESPSPTSPDR